MMKRVVGECNEVVERAVGFAGDDEVAVLSHLQRNSGIRWMPLVHESHLHWDEWCFVRQSDKTRADAGKPSGNYRRRGQKRTAADWRTSSCSLECLGIEEPPNSELDVERTALARIRAVHNRHLDDARANATRLADESAEQTEEGIRDLADDDGEGEAAAQAVLVRQASARAMHSIRRVRELEAVGQALAFGHVTSTEHDRTYVGRLSVIDYQADDGDDVLLVDWRAHAAAPFYRATPLDNLGITHRRHLLYDSITGELNGYSDEVFDAETMETTIGLRGEAAIMAALNAPSDGRMKSVVATIQSEQDAVIRAPAKGALVVQGGPGTGKTVVALHRAAYLLYNQRAALAESGVLVVGPTNEFLNYISGVLPSLGETGVVSVTATELYPGIRMGRVDSAETAELKGQVVMADFLATAVALRQRRPTSGLAAWYGAAKVTLNAEQVVEMFDTAQRHRTHNDGSVAFRTAIIDALSAAGYDPSFGDLEEARSAFESSADVDAFMLKHWPTLTPEQALNDTLGSPAIMRMAGEKVGLTPQQLQLLARDRDKERALSRRRWSDADVPLLDELLAIVGGALGGDIDSDRTIERDEADEFELATAYDESDDADDFLDDESEQDHDDLWSLDELVAEEQRDHDRLDQRRRAGG